MTHNDNLILEVKTPVENYFSDLTPEISSILSPTEVQLALEMAKAEVDEAIRTEIGEDNFNTIENVVNSSEKYQLAEAGLLKRNRRSRIAMMGFGLIAAISFGKAADHTVESEFTFFSNVPINMAYSNVQDCYDDPAKEQLILDGIYRDVEPTDDASITNCLVKIASVIDGELQDEGDNKIIKPYKDEFSELIKDIEVLAASPEGTNHEFIADQQSKIQEDVLSRDDHLAYELLAGIGFMLLGTVSLMPTMVSRENLQIRKRTLRLLSALRNYKYEDALNAVNTDIYARMGHTSEVTAHQMTSLVTGQVKEITLLPQKDSSVDKRYDNRWNSLYELSKVLNSAGTKKV